MKEEGQHTYICIDLKSFYASVECVERHLDPLKANLLVADESRTDKTICLAVSPALKALGVPGRPRLFEAKQAIGNAENALHRKINYIIAPPRMSTYIRYSAKVYSVYLKFFSAENIHVYSVDEVFIDITPYASIYSCSAHDLVRMVIQEILKETGITATGGIGTNMYLAKVAMDIVAKHRPADKDGVRIAELTEDSYKELLWSHTPLTDFWQIAHGISGRLARYGIHTMRDIAEVSVVNESLLYQVFGVNAELLIDHAWGIEPCTMKDIKNYHTGSRSISNGQVLPRAYSFEEAQLAVKEQAELLSLQMVREKVTADSMTMYVGYEVCSPGYTGQYRNAPLRHLHELLETDHSGCGIPLPADRKTGAQGPAHLPHGQSCQKRAGYLLSAGPVFRLRQDGKAEAPGKSCSDNQGKIWAERHPPRDQPV